MAFFLGFIQLRNIHSNPTIAKVNKFNYLKSLLEGQAAWAIEGLTLTSANYDAAITILPERFGKTQQTIAAHIDKTLMLEQMVETRAWKAARGLIEDGRCRVCQEQVETVEHLVAGCKVLANTEYLTRHNRAMMIMALSVGKRTRTD